VCSKCKAQHIRHRACLICGTYRSQTVIDVTKKALKKEKKAKEREQA